MKKRILFAVLGIAALIVALAAVKALQIRTMMEQGEKFVPPPETVTTAVAKKESWETSLTAVGSLSAVNGVTVSAELAGKVVAIVFKPGTEVDKGDILVRQDTSTEESLLPGALAQVDLTRIILERDEKMVAERIISRSDYDTSVANHAQALAQANSIRATIGKKTIRAPFRGRIGIRQVNLGQVLDEGAPIATLQSLDPIHVDFSVPQQQLPLLSVGLPVSVTCDALPALVVTGRVTTVEPLVDPATRNVRVQAMAANPGEKLRPGMFINAAVGLPVRAEVLSVPVTAVLYAPYGDSVFVVDDDGKGRKVLRQQFVRLGVKRGDFIAVTEGLKEGESVVSTGVFKLQNGQAVVVDNRLAPNFRKSPEPENN